MTIPNTVFERYVILIAAFNRFLSSKNWLFLVLCLGTMSSASVIATQPGPATAQKAADKHANEILADIQRQLNQASPGSTLTVPPGRYPSGLWVRKPVVLNLAGVQLGGTVGHKAILVIENADGPVVVNDFTANGAIAGAQSGNLAGIRVSGKNFDVTLNRAHISYTVMGILTDGRGGRLIINNSLIEDMGQPDRGQNLSHNIYAGRIDTLVINNSILRRSHNLGHLVKSRARHTQIIDSHILGMDSRHSRVLDLPCGGELSVYNSTLQSSPYNDNFDLISLGVESAANCKQQLDNGSVDIRHSILVFDRVDAELNIIFNWAVPVSRIMVRDNKIVHPVRPLFWQVPGRLVRIPDLSPENQHYRNRRDAGLNSVPGTQPAEKSGLE